MKEWEPKIKEMIPSYGLSLAAHPELLQKVMASITQSLGLREEAPQKHAYF
ncbi:putative malate:quinone oxidoreductase 1 [compost metagenome]